MTSARECPQTGLAAFLVGSLCYEGYLPLNLNDSDSRQDYVGAIRLTAAILDLMQPKPNGDQMELPFVW